MAIDESRKRVMFEVWHVAALNRAKSLPDLSRLMGIAPKVMDDEELWTNVMAWVTQHNARFANQGGA